MIKDSVCLSKVQVYLLPLSVSLKAIYNQTELQIFKNSVNLPVSYRFYTKLEKENNNKELDIRDLEYSYKDKYRHPLSRISNGSSELSINNSKLLQIIRGYRISTILDMTNRYYKLPLECINTLPDTGIRIFQSCVYFFKVFYAKIAYNVKVSKKYTIPNIISIFTNRYHNKITDNKLKNTRFFNIQKLPKLFIHTIIGHNTFW
ncbi:P44/Msp2 family outer membrane protein [Ehrlichia ruminantium]|uniref:P44/Msp2 family outer membrane protein n=1 Tax=Ehrlichia ruminantium TaxID=779 RepID=UPI000EF334B5|nr:P44/Msp2 family outer membrane protein [Ehrlichia ruminantium]QLK58295.1 P44/Msp2 family outer membrane protein [Ehrlichia ruminantium]UOD97860.1 P44/Msp2 family outer membrane protein [Ehrlichia ruminantium]